jgi:hypothetical protein
MAKATPDLLRCLALASLGLGWIGTVSCNHDWEGVYHQHFDGTQSGGVAGEVDGGTRVPS